MPFVRRYKDLNTDSETLYKDIVNELQNEKELNIGKDLKGDVNGVPFMSVTANRTSIPKLITGTLREATVTITGEGNDYLIEMHTGAWFGNMILPGAGGSLVAGPFGAVATVGGTVVLAAEYGRKLKNRIKELVKKHSGKAYSESKIETFVS